MRQPHNIFMSSAASDREFADRLSKALAASGHRVSVDVEITPGEKWWDWFRDTIGQSDAMILLAPPSLQNAWVMSEVGAAFAARKPVIPVIPANRRLQSGVAAPLRELKWIRAGNRPIEAVVDDINERLEHSFADPHA